MPHNTAFQCKDVPGCWVVVIQKNRRRWQHLCTEMQQDEFETRVTFVLCFRARHYSCPSKSSCKVTGMTTTSTGLWQISLLTAVHSCRGLKKREKTVKWQTPERAIRLLPNDWRCHDSSARILQRTDGPLLISESSRSLWRSFIHKQCWCFPADVWTGSLSWSLVWNQLGFNYPQDEEGMQVYFTKFFSAGHKTQLAARSWRDFSWNEFSVKTTGADHLCFPLDGLWWFLVMLFLFFF